MRVSGNGHGWYFQGIFFNTEHHSTLLMLDMFLVFGFFCRIKLLKAEGRQTSVECEEHYAIPEWATEDLRNGQRGIDENSQLPVRGQIQHQDRLPTCPGLLLALLWDGLLFGTSFPPTLSPHVSVSKEKFLTFQEPCFCPCPSLKCPP